MHNQKFRTLHYSDHLPPSGYWLCLQWAALGNNQASLIYCSHLLHCSSYFSSKNKRRVLALIGTIVSSKNYWAFFMRRVIILLRSILSGHYELWTMHYELNFTSSRLRRTDYVFNGLHSAIIKLAWYIALICSIVPPIFLRKTRGELLLSLDHCSS